MLKKFLFNDGAVTTFFDYVGTSRYLARIYYVNGINTSSDEHAKTCRTISRLTQHPVTGVYVASWGHAGADVLLDCIRDWAIAFSAKFKEYKENKVAGFITDIKSQLDSVMDFFRKNPKDQPKLASKSDRQDSERAIAEIFRIVPPTLRPRFIDFLLSMPGIGDEATRSLFNQLRSNSHDRQFVIAHSRGNLVTCNALWCMVIAYGNASLHNIRVYSLASPTPGWPYAIRKESGGGGRRVYGYQDDLVTRLDPHNFPFMNNILGGVHGRTIGDWQRMNNRDSLQPHAISGHIDKTSFIKDIRRDLGLPENP